MSKYAASLLLILVLLFAGWSALAAERVANFKLKGVDGEAYELKDVAADSRAILIDFWSTNCKPCKKLMPHLQTFYEVYAPAGLEVLVISRDTTLTVSKVKPTVAAEGWTFPVLYDTDLKVSDAYHVRFAPVTFLINNKGEVLFHHSGFKPGQEKDYEEEIISALELTEEQVEELYAAWRAEDAEEPEAEAGDDAPPAAEEEAGASSSGDEGAPAESG
jgi:peroxiredoxin